MFLLEEADLVIPTTNLPHAKTLSAELHLFQCSVLQKAYIIMVYRFLNIPSFWQQNEGISNLGCVQKMLTLVAFIFTQTV